MQIRRTLLTVCTAGILISASLPWAAISLIAPTNSGSFPDEAHYLRGISDTPIGYCRPLRSSQQDLKELQTTSLQPDVVSPICSLCVELPRRLGAKEERCSYPADCGSLLSLHCQLIV